MATFEQQCQLVSEKYLESRNRSTSDQAVVAIFERFDMAGPLASALIGGDIEFVSGHPSQWIAETYLALIKISPIETNDINVIDDKRDSSLFSVDKNGSEALPVAIDQPILKEPIEDKIPMYEYIDDQIQNNQMQEIIDLYKNGDVEKALESVPSHISYLKTLDNVDLYAAYNIGYVLHEDESASPQTEAMCRNVFEFVASFSHEIGGAAANTFAFSYLIPEGNLEEAEKVLRRAISWNLGFQSMNAMSNLGQIFFRKKDFFRAEAIFTYIRVFELKDLRPEANFWLGRIYFETGRSEQAEAVWKEASLAVGDSYQELAAKCLKGELPKIDYLEGVSENEFIPAPLAKNTRLPESIPDLEEAKQLLLAKFPGLAFEAPIRKRKVTPSKHAEASNFLNCLDEAHYQPDVVRADRWIHLIDCFADYDALDEPVVRFVAEIAQRSLNLGNWQDAGAFARTHFILGNLEVCLAAWRVQYELAVPTGDADLLAASMFPIISLFAHLSRCDKGILAQDLAKAGKIEESEVIKFLDSGVQERHDSLSKALSTISKFADETMAFSELSKAVVLIRDEEWTEVRQYLWEIDSKRLELGDESNNGLQSEMHRLNCLMGRCGHEQAPEHSWVSGIDLFSAALIDAYYSRWDRFSLNIAEAMDLSEEHSRFGTSIFKKMSGALPLRAMAADETLPRPVFEMMCDIASVETLVIMARNDASKEIVASKNPSTYSIIMGTARKEDLILALETNIVGLAELVAQYQYLDEDLISILAKYDNDSILKSLLQNKNCNSSVALDLITRISTDSCWELAGEIQTDPEVLDYLSRHESESVRRAVARNSNAPVTCFERLASDSAWAVRDAVKNNEKAPDSARAIALFME